MSFISNPITGVIIGAGFYMLAPTIGKVSASLSQKITDIFRRFRNPAEIHDIPQPAPSPEIPLSAHEMQYADALVKLYNCCFPDERREFPESYADIGQIQSLMVRNRENLKLIQRLDLSHQNLQMIPAEINFLVNLQRLDLSHNNLTEAPDLDANTQLQIADLSYNRIERRPSFLDHPHLKRINLSYNQLKKPPYLGKLPELISLDLSHNLLTRCPRFSSDTELSRGLYPNLLFVQLEFNSLREISTDIADLMPSCVVRLKNNPFSDEYQQQVAQEEDRDLRPHFQFFGF